MSFTNQQTNIQYVADGNTDRFAINFHILENTFGLTATVYDVTDPLNPITVVIPYSIDHTNYPNSEVVFISDVPLGHIVLIERTTTLTQDSSFMKGAFPAEAVEETFDKSMLILQEHGNKIARAYVEPLVGPSILDRVDAVEDTIEDVELDITTIENDITAIQGDLIALFGNDTALQDQIDDMQIAIVVVSSGGVVNPNNNEIIIIKTAAAVTIALPDATTNLGLNLKVKLGQASTNVTLSSTQNIDGFGTSYPLSSLYESVSVVSDGTQWFII